MASPGNPLVDGGLSGLDVVNVARIPAVETADPHGKCVAERNVDCTAHAVSGLIPVVYRIQVCLHPPTETTRGRVGGDKLEQATEAVGAIERALRATEDLDSL